MTPELEVQSVQPVQLSLTPPHARGGKDRKRRTGCTGSEADGQRALDLSRRRDQRR